MCSSACKRARPGTPCHCDCRRTNHGRWYGRSSYAEFEYEPPRRRIYRELARRRIVRPAPPPPPSRVRHGITRQVVKTAVIGVSCAAFPGACPAIVAFGKVADVFNSARNIVSQVQSARYTPGTVAHSLAGHLAGEALAHVVGPWSRLVTDGIVSTVRSDGLNTECVRTIVSSTIAGVMREGFDGLASWSVGNT